MSILTAASSKSAWRGYEYFMEDKVQFVKKLDKTHFSGAVAGNGTEPYAITMILNIQKGQPVTVHLLTVLKFASIW